ncbi:hypothetical protein RA28_06075 [Ruegeria sp. ANG-S4]|uniref:MFS transporter n=1 Tax=Ruegeria sp. ANG-S4 TaxID=1577904 RepID=UPI00057DCFF6|nr:MFS transporter [Ruegeria sp. ANG-S4]KIC47232.1 hypothetical protein RA28_06075 [Ruegeria sp. ANG-S4]
MFVKTWGEAMVNSDKKPVANVKRNRAYLLWGGIADSLSDILASPSIVLPFLYLALGAPQFLAGLLLPCVKGARIVAEATMSPYIKLGDRSKKAMILPNLVIALVLAVLALSGAALPNGIVMVLFVLVALIVGCCYGIWALGSNHIYGSELEDEERGQIVFTQLALSCVIAIALVWTTRALMAGETPFERHRVLLWLGVLALLVSCFCMFRLVLTKSPHEAGASEATEQKESFFKQVARGWSLALQFAWFRRFLVARVFFLSVELATPFYTIHAATYHLSTPHILSIFVTATSAGRAIGAMLWRRVVQKSIRYTIAGASMIACLSSLMAIGFDLFGLASNPWVYAATIFFLSFGIGGETEGRYLYLLSMSSASNRPYMVALADAVAGIGGIIFASVLGIVAQIHSALIPLSVLAVLNGVSVYLALSLVEKKPEPR